jgi:hypothetical protein
MTKAIPDQMRLALHSCFQSNDVVKTFSKDGVLYRHNGTDITVPTMIEQLRSPHAASEESEETWVSQPIAPIRLER